MDTKEFLTAILPSQGVYIAAIPRDAGGYGHKTFTDIDEMVSFVKWASRKGLNVFHACASFSEPKVWNEDQQKWQTRTHDNAALMRSQWIDIDCGPGKDYPNQKAGFTALYEFCKTTGISMPNILVNSGNGIHGYWTFDHDVPKAVWHKTAKLFKAICSHVGFKADPARTADMSSVLRPIGTVNDKTHKGLGVTEVKLLKCFDTSYSFKQWVHKLVEVQQELNVHVKASKEKSRNSDLLGGREFPPADAELVASRCQQVKFFKDSLGANQSEPEWRACLGVVSFCVDGIEKCHEWSSGHEDYSPTKTDSKIEQWKRNAGPASCEHFNGLDNGRCAGCKYASRVTNPIFLGQPMPEHQTEMVVETVKEQVVINEDGDEVIKKVVEKKTITIPDLPSHVAKDFAWNDGVLEGRVVTPSKKEEGAFDESWQPVCAQFPILNYLYFDQDRGEYMYRISVLIKDTWREADISMLSVGKGGATLTGELAASAGVIARGNGQLLVRYMKTWIEAMQMEHEEITMHTHFGWQKDGSFLLGDRKFTPDGEIKTVLVSSSLKPWLSSYEPAGDLKCYCELIDRAYNRPEHHMYQFTWLAGFGNALLRKAHNGKVGIVLSGWSTKPGFGKSTATQMALSVWGNPQGWGQSNSAAKITPYAMYRMSGEKRDLPVILDETTDMAGEDIASLAYAFSDGSPKLQGKADGSIRDNSNYEWSSFLFTSANKSMHSEMASAIPNCAPQLVRVWDYQYDSGHAMTMSREEGAEVFNELSRHYGIAGEEFLKYVVPRIDKVVELCHKAEAMFAKAIGLDKDARFWLRTAGVVWASFLITRKLGMHNFDEATLKKWICDSLRVMTNSIGESNRDQLDVFSSILSDLQSGFIVTDTEGDMRAHKPAQFLSGYSIPKGTITGRAINDTRRLYLAVNSVREWCRERKLSVKELELALDKKGYLLRHDRFNLGKGTKVVSSQAQVWVLDWGKFASHLVGVPAPLEIESTDSVTAAAR